MAILDLGDRGPEVRTLQQQLVQRGYAIEVDGEFGPETNAAVRAFQSQNLDERGEPLAVDGRVGALTWWSLTSPKPDVQPVASIDYAVLPPAASGGSALGRATLATAITELKAGAGEVGGNNRGPFVKKYLQPAGLGEGESWCASFVSWCLLQASGGAKSQMPVAYNPGARALLGEFQDKGWAKQPGSNYTPLPGDLVFWWRVQLNGWQGHVGLVHQVRNGMLHTIEGNRSPNVQGFSYVLSRMDQLLGFGHLP